jgi:hypothetical protein
MIIRLWPRAPKGSGLRILGYVHNQKVDVTLKITIIFFIGARVFIARHAKLKAAKIKGLYALQRNHAC